ncbi:hypothetical protein OPT61_g4970 [Boeremia exigua]|uniref:Uncharacterized protein n=1 Tax=Boeremia exigua TaxID=749465 RepID=A0ACC2IC18_9PLEO|nr:hypothetical protein OPT61_g4970 [Boeremia exigua]
MESLASGGYSVRDHDPLTHLGDHVSGLLWLQVQKLTYTVSPKPGEQCEEARKPAGDELAPHDAAPAEAAKRLSR